MGKRYTYSREEVEAALKEASSIKDVMLNLGMKISNGNYPRVRFIVEEHGLELPKFDLSSAARNLKQFNKIPDTEYFTSGTLRQGTNTKKRLIEDHGWQDRCMMDDCPSPDPVWRGERLCTQLDHIDGDRYNNQIENLRFLCPNCHTQTETYANNLKSIQVRYNYCECGSRIDKKSIRCQTCNNKERLETSSNVYPPVEDLVKMIKESSVLAVGKKLGVSDNAVRYYLKRRGVDTKTIK